MNINMNKISFETNDGTFSGFVSVEVKNKVSKAAMEAVYYGSQLGSVSVVTYGDASEEILKELGNYGAENILVCRSLNESNGED